MQLRLIRHATLQLQITVYRTALWAKVVAVHIEAVNHYRLRRDELAACVKSEQLKISSDGETLVW